ncbi:replication endonuclease [Serratia rubidaea]|uniref:replication endonuclease n=1 Tax=Serratia rubidaea TaxID=61652 RepID=UPI0022B8E58E|nr:replication endonuclease [Serratia rubidaea]WBF43753.1 replication endonuclease [Serratia rubidaea]
MSKSHKGRYSPTPPPPYPGSGVVVSDYPHEWNKPKAAIHVDKSPAVDLVELAQEQEFYTWVKRTLAPLPRFIRRRLSDRIDSVNAKKGRHIARLKLSDIIRRDLPALELVRKRYAICGVGEEAEAFSHLEPVYHEFTHLRGLIERFNRLPDYSDEDIELLAQDIAIYINSVLSELNEAIGNASERTAAIKLYREAAKTTAVFMLAPPLSSKKSIVVDEAAAAILRMRDAAYWHRNLRKYARRWREHLHIAFGDVRRGVSPYCSKHHAEAWEQRRKRSRTIMSKLELEDQDTGERISLIEQIDKSNANPEKRRAELMTRIGGFEKVAIQEEFAGSFFTLTAPSCYHAYTYAGHRNSKWNGASPRLTQQYLNRVWQQIRAELKRQEIPVFGLRVAESHHDGTPHWHGLLFTLPEHTAELEEIMRDYATRANPEELQGKHGQLPRFELKPIDESIGSATGYIVKYISKNIDGYALDGQTDDESGRPLKETAQHATAWASCWGIRQFQFMGGAPVSVWRELRRMKNQELADQINPLFGELHRAADKGLWNEYTLLQGGPFVLRKNLQVRTYYQAKVEPNDYGEYQTVIKGLIMPSTNVEPVETRTRYFRIVRIKPESTTDTDQGVAVDLALDLQGASAPPWTRVNNCTEREKRAITESNPPPNNEPEQLEIGQKTAEQRKRLADSLKNHKPARKKSPAEEFESLAYAITAGECSEAERQRAESYLRAAKAIRENEEKLSPLVADVAKHVKRWAKIRGIHVGEAQATQLAQGKKVTVLDTVYRANTVTGELIVVGADKQWRKSIAKHQAAKLVSRWQKAGKIHIDSI